MEQLSMQAEDSRLQTPKQHYLKFEDSLIKLEYLQDTNDSTPRREPTEKELCQCIIMIKDHFPQCRLDRVIQLLNDTLIRNEQEAQRERLKEKARQIRLLQEDDYLSDDDQQQMTFQEKERLRQEYSRKFQNSDANPRFYEERQIAKLFCLKGYGYPTARQYLGDNITPNRYNNVITTIVRLSYRKLQYYILKYINPRLSIISREELKMIKTPLVNCRNWMTQRQAQNFHRFVKLTYKIATEDPEKEVAMELLQAIMNQLKKRNLTYKHHRRGEEHSGWTEQTQRNLVFHYLKNVTIQQLQRELMLQHPAFRSAFEIGRLRLKIDRLIRFAVKKVNGDRQKYGINDVTLISDFFTNKIIRAPHADEVRKRLLAYYIDRDRNAPKIKWVFESFRDFLQKNKEEFEEIEDSSCEVVPKQELKAQEQQPAPSSEPTPHPDSNPNLTDPEISPNPKEEHPKLGEGKKQEEDGPNNE